MRTFGKTAPEYFEFTLEGSKKTYRIPLSATMEAQHLSQFEQVGNSFTNQVEWLRNFMGDDVDKVPSSVTSDIIKAWADECNGQGATPGES